MLKQHSAYIKFFEDGDYLIEVVHDDDTLEAWLWRKDYCIKEFMFGVNDDVGINSFLDTIESVLPEYEKAYNKNIEDEEELYVDIVEEG